MNIEPVAWMNPLDEKHIEDKDYGDWIPLYPAPKELTDEEIAQIATPFYDEENLIAQEFDFARAILRKAREK